MGKDTTMTRQELIKQLKQTTYRRAKEQDRFLAKTKQDHKQDIYIKTSISTLSQQNTSLISIRRNLQLYRLTESLEVSVDWLFDRTEPKQYAQRNHYDTAEQVDPILRDRLHTTLNFLTKDIERRTRQMAYLAEHYDYSISTVEGWLVLRSYPRIHTAYQIAEDADISMDWLLGIVDDPFAHKRHVLPDDYPYILS